MSRAGTLARQASSAIPLVHDVTSDRRETAETLICEKLPRLQRFLFRSVEYGDFQKAPACFGARKITAITLERNRSGAVRMDIAPHEQLLG